MPSTFNTLGLPEPLIDALAQLGITTPTDIQEKAFPVLNKSNDAWLSSPTGSGKTFAYLLPLLKHLDLDSIDLQVIILAPTHELAAQIHECIRTLYQSTAQKPRTQLIIGNASIKRQQEKLKKKPHVIVGSCGRIIDLGMGKKLKLHKCKCIVVDEADSMMEQDSIDRLKQLLKMVPNERQLVFASATEKSNTFTIAQEIGSNVQWLQGEDSEADPHIEHYYIQETHIHKTDALRKLLNAIKPEKTIVFLHRNKTATLVQEKLEAKGLDLVLIHGSLSKLDRQKALTRFRQGKAKILVSSDISARGLDIRGVTHIINLDAPTQSDDYTHRAGRTGRMGANGTAITIIAPNELNLIKKYERELDITIAGATVRNGEFRANPSLEVKTKQDDAGNSSSSL